MRAAASRSPTYDDTPQMERSTVTSVAVSSRAITRLCAAVSPRLKARRLSSSSSSDRVRPAQPRPVVELDLTQLDPGLDVVRVDRYHVLELALGLGAGAAA